MYARILRYLIPLALVAGVVFYVYSTQNTIKQLTRENVSLELSNETLARDLISLKKDIELQIKRLDTLNKEITEANATAKQNLKAFEDSDLNSLSNARPGLIERTINRGTKDVFKSFELESAN